MRLGVHSGGDPVHYYMTQNPEVEVEAEARMHYSRRPRWKFFPNVVSLGEGAELYGVDRMAVQLRSL